MLGMLGKCSEDGVEGRLLGAFGAHGVLHRREHLAVILVTLHLLEAAPPQIADEEVLYPGEQQVDPILEIAVQVHMGAAKVAARVAEELRVVVFAAVDLDEPAIAGECSLGLEEDVPEPVSAGVSLARIVEPEVDAGEARLLEKGDRRAFELAMIEGRQASLARGGKKHVLIRNDAARDHDPAHARTIHVFDVGASALPLAALIADAARYGRLLWKSAAQVAVADFREPLKMREQSFSVLGIGTSASPTHDHLGHGRPAT